MDDVSSDWFGDKDQCLLEEIDLSRVGHVLDLDQYKIAEIYEKGASSFISPIFYNKGLYRVRNSGSGIIITDFAVCIEKVGAATYEGLVSEMGEDCVDKRLWRDVPAGDVIFFYSLRREDEFVRSSGGEDLIVV
ncbi:hypothetical protein B6V01_004275 [Methanosarcinales archaeon ex4572_44]|nr:MAG: hypothetical protein B6U67_01115 [Methanosarcinales archaeon ex4484_138]PHP45374.1 MAG: hypothetical protein B6V01_004275 [Methanosarcinales archaeon ex4572_44]RLG25340.1 MAG: hypothetical protein DRN85_06075 [Methanosarcinales archaeon]RLG28199.1 MAG: hypothetical protein DRN70_00940 [Methanosarcinales archaeon]